MQRGLLSKVFVISESTCSQMCSSGVLLTELMYPPDSPQTALTVQMSFVSSCCNRSECLHFLPQSIPDLPNSTYSFFVGMSNTSYHMRRPANFQLQISYSLAYFNPTNIMIYAIKKFFFWVVWVVVYRLKQKHWRWIVNTFPLNKTFWYYITQCVPGRLGSASADVHLLVSVQGSEAFF